MRRGAEKRRHEDEICSLFFRSRRLVSPPARASDDPPRGSRPYGLREYLFTYLRAPDAGGERLPAAFIEKLRRALAHYGVTSPRSGSAEARGGPTADLQVGRTSSPTPTGGDRAAHNLERRIATSEILRPAADGELRGAPGSVGARRAMDASRPSTTLPARSAIGNFDEPLFEQARDLMSTDQMDAHLHVSQAQISMPRTARSEDQRARRVPAAARDGLGGCFVISRPEDAGAHARECSRGGTTGFDSSSSVVRDGREWSALCLAEYDYEGKRIHVLSTLRGLRSARRRSKSVRSALGKLPAEHDVVVDFYLWSPRATAGVDATELEIRAVLNRTPFPRRLRRIVVVVSGPGGSRGMGSVQHFTYRPTDDGYCEERLYRGLHPMMGKRLHLWRTQQLRDRAAAIDGRHLSLSRRGSTNPKDERLFAIAEVRDLTPVCDQRGRVVQLPYLEHMLVEALAAIRRYQTSAQGACHGTASCSRRLARRSTSHRTSSPASCGAGTTDRGRGHRTSRRPRPQCRTRKPASCATGCSRISNPDGTGPRRCRSRRRASARIPLSEYDQKVLRMRQRGLVYPYEIIKSSPREGTRSTSRPATSSSTISTWRTASWPWIVRPGGTPPTSSSG